MRNGPYELVIAPFDYPGKRYRGRYCYEHILVWWRNTGEIPGPDEVIHHKDENKRNNAYENLEKMTKARHTQEHDQERAPDPIEVTCGWCGTNFAITPGYHRQRMKQTQSGLLFCTHSCQAYHQFNS